MVRRIVAVVIAVGLCLLVVVPALATTIYVPLVSRGNEPATRVPVVTPSPTSTPLPNIVASLVVTHTSIFTTSAVPTLGGLGYTTIYGEVLNTGTSTVDRVQVVAKFYDATDALVALVTGEPFVNEILPGQAAAFSLSLEDPPANITHYTASVLTASAGNSYGLYRHPTVLSQSTRSKQSGTEVFGEIINDQGVPLFSVRVVATFYDAQGNVVDLSTTWTKPEQVPVNATAIYTIDFYRPVVWTRYTIQTEATR